jgi:selenocysteine lyase/cysteine desulfurase
VMWHTGFRVDLEVICAYCKANDIISIVDVTQSLGTIPIDFQTTGADVLLCSTYKWLSAGFGLGLMAMSDSFFKRYPPKIGGYASFQDVNGEWIYQHSMKSYQPGSLSITSMAILKNSIEEINAISVEVIHERSIKRAAQLVQLLEKHPVKLLGAPRGSSLSNIVCIETVDGLFHHLEKNEVIIVERNKHIRMSVTHLTTDGELKELDAILSRFFTA